MTQSPPVADREQSVQPASGFHMQAIVVIHGIGEQKPMDTIKAFVRSVWAADGAVHVNRLPHPDEVWSKPDMRTGSLELRRLTTRPSTSSATFEKGARQDFYELYWADLSGGSTWDQVKNWIGKLLVRNPRTRVPPDVRQAWWLLWIVTLVVVLLVGAAALPVPKPAWAPAWLLLGVGAILGWAVHQVVVPYVGRVVRYTRAVPDNIAAREAIRERGLKLLTALHSQAYDRIIVVGHSLGSLVAYDLVSYFWARHLASHTMREGTDEFAALCALEQAAAAVETATDPEAKKELALYWEAQRHFCRLLRTRPMNVDLDKDTRWLITDLVTVGSPLGHADFLLANSPIDMKQRIKEREFATCPPLREELDPKVLIQARAAGLPVEGAKPGLFSFPLHQDKDEWQLHQAAQFAVVRWTNIFDPPRLVFQGDIISAPAVPIFGPGVIDIDLRARRGRQSPCFTHTRYWQEGDPPSAALAALREALDLAAQRNP